MFGGKALGWMAGTLSWMPGARRGCAMGKRTLSVGGVWAGRRRRTSACTGDGLRAVMTTASAITPPAACPCARRPGVATTFPFLWPC